MTAKYARRRFAPLPGTLPGGSAPAALWEAAQHGDVRCAPLTLNPKPYIKL